jgi:hypothetical protein
MTRYFAPAMFLAATIWVGWYNRTHGASKILIPFVDILFAGDADDRQALGERSVQVLFAATLVVLGLTVIEHVRALRAPPGG